MSSSVDVTRQKFRILLLVLLVISGFLAAWSWLRPYEWSADSKARCLISGCQVVQDHRNYWVNLQLKVTDDEEHDLSQMVQLLTANGRVIHAADVTLEGNDVKPITRIWIKFWLDEADFAGPLKLRINDGELTVRSGSGLPKLRSRGSRYFVTCKW